jgi:hypothetical protein
VDIIDTASPTSHDRSVSEGDRDIASSSAKKKSASSRFLDWRSLVLIADIKSERMLAVF